MKKTVLKIFSVALCLCMSVSSVFFTACKKGMEQTNGPTKNEDVDLELDTTHIYEAKKTDSWVVKAGKSDYVIVIPVSASVNEVKAATVVQRYFLEATGISLSIANDSAVTTETVISVGETLQAQKASMEYEYEEITTAGFQIKTKGKTLYLLGGEEGIVYSAYELCWHWFGLDYYGDYCYSLNKNVSELPLMEYNVHELPDFLVNHPAIGTSIFAEDSNLKDAWRYSRNDERFVYGSIYGSMHNTFKIVPPSEYYSTHKEWYSEEMTIVDGDNIPAQLCFSRDPDGLLEVVLEKLKESVRQMPDVNIVPFSHEDIKSWCSCDSCDALAAEYDGCITVGYVRFLRKLGDQLNAWAKSELNRDVKIQALAYNPTEDVPAKYDEATGEYVPLDETCELGENVYIYYCPHGDYYVPFDEEVNSAVLETLQSWAALTPRMYIFMYNMTMYPNYFVFSGTFGSMQRNYQLMNKYKAVSLYDLGPYDTHGVTGFNVLKNYLSAKLAWNCQLDFNDLVDRFFENYFGVAAEPMRAMYDTCMNKLMYLHDTEVLDWDWKRFLNEDTYYSVGFVNTLLTYVEEAFALIKPYEESNYALYKKLYDRINLESLSPRYIQIEMYYKNYTAEDLLTMKYAFKEDCTALDIARLGESAARSIETLWESWGIS